MQKLSRQIQCTLSRRGIPSGQHNGQELGLRERLGPKLGETFARPLVLRPFFDGALIAPHRSALPLRSDPSHHPDGSVYQVTFALKYSMVSISPARNSTVGSQPQSCLARAMSGWRRLGSSCGSGREMTLLRLPVN